MDESGLNFNPPIGTAQELEPGLKRILAPNPSPMTFRGTNTYMLGTSDIAIIDPGPEDDQHLTNILRALKTTQKITHILVTHSHIDHSPLAKRLSELTGAKIYARGPTGIGQSAIMRDLLASGYVGGGEGSDDNFSPDICLNEGDIIDIAGRSVEVIFTPGHFGNHVSFAWNDALVSGDHVMDWATSMVSPPDGDLADFMASCRKLEERDWRIFYPGHGAPVQDPKARLNWLLNHRLQRETQILDQLRIAPRTPKGLAEAIYTDTDSSLLGAAARNVFAHLIDLCSRGKVETDGPPRFEKTYALGAGNGHN
jgi:glyoxylase-like metal-dependent hydrolase (beta-lactamase superfamily II)